MTSGIDIGVFNSSGGGDWIAEIAEIELPGKSACHTFHAAQERFFLGVT